MSEEKLYQTPLRGRLECRIAPREFFEGANELGASAAQAEADLAAAKGRAAGSERLAAALADGADGAAPP